jgi:enolase
VSATTISGVRGRRVWDSRGRPTVEAEIRLAGGAAGRAIAPAGASTGSGEAVDLRDGGTRFGGHDVTRAVAAVNEVIAPALAGADAADQAVVDGLLCELDGTPDKRRLGGNAAIAVSMAAAHAAAAASGLSLWRHLGGDEAVVMLPLPEIQIFGGGAHAAGRLDVQDFLVVCPGAATFAEALDWTAEVYRAAGALMAEAGRLKGVADEGGFWPDFDSNEQALEMLTRAIERAGFRPVEQVAIALDIAATQLGSAGRYRWPATAAELDTDGLIEVIEGWLGRYPIVSVEDPLAEDDAEGFVRFTRRNGDRVQVVGDDFLVTDADRVRAAAQTGACTTVLVKPNQRGTLTETRSAGTPPAPTAWAASPRPARARART